MTRAKLNVGVGCSLVVVTMGETVESLVGDLIPSSSLRVFNFGKDDEDLVFIGLGPTKFPSRSESGERIVGLASDEIDSANREEWDC